MPERPPSTSSSTASLADPAPGSASSRISRAITVLVVAMTSVMALDLSAIAAPRQATVSAPKAAKAAPKAVAPAGKRIQLRKTKPVASNTGAGVLRARPTRLAGRADGHWSKGVLTIKKDLRNRVVNGTVKVAANGVTIENCIIRGDKENPPRNSRLLVNTDGARGTVVRYNDIRSSFRTRFLSGIGHRNVVAEFNEITHVTDGFIPSPGRGPANVHMVIRGNYVHDFAFYGNDPGHAPTPLFSAGGIRIRGPWAGKPWNHADAVQVEKNKTTGLNVYGNNFDARWARDSVSTLPLPNAIKQLSAFMLNGGRRLVIADNWINGGEYAINNADHKVTGKIVRNRFGRAMAHRGTSDRGYYALMIASPRLRTYDGTRDRNVWSNSGRVVHRRQN